MGLDMYLEKETYVKNWDFQKPEERHQVVVTKGGHPVESIDPSKVKYVVEEVGYWRKANAIHHWFVENVQGGRDERQKSYVSREKLEELLTLVERVLADHSLAEELLPPQAGFFFGSTEIGEWYFQDLEETQRILKDALSSDSGTYYYQSSW